MKKLFFFGALAALLLGTASCSKDMEPEMMSDGTVSFKVELPGNFDSRAISDGTTATKLEVACYDANGTKLDITPTVKTDFVNREATITYKLVKGQTYNFAFFAHADGAPYTFTPGTNMAGCKFEVDYEGDCNDESRDAFYAVLKDYTVTTAETTVTLYRPFAQLNFGADDLAAASAAGITPSQSMVTVKKAATSFGLFTEETDGEEDVEYTLANLPNDPPTLSVEGTNYAWMEMCYFLVPGNEANVDVEMTLKTNGSDVKVPVANVPVKKNHRTNIVGSLFTQDANFRIIIDQNFDNYDYDIVNGKLMLKNGMTAEEINKIIENGFASFALAEDVDIDNSIVIPAGKTVTLDLNGHKLYNTQDIWNETTYKYELISVEGGNLTINGEGDVIAKADDCYPVSVWGGGNLVINGGNYNGNIHAVYVARGTATINGGSFTLQQLDPTTNDYRQEINCLDANYTNGTAKIIVTGGKFYQFDPANSMSEPIAPISLLAAGYESVQDGEWYEVREITPLTDVNAIKEAVQEPGKTVVVASSVMLEIDPATIATGVTLLGKEGASVKFLNQGKVINENITIQGFKISNTGVTRSANLDLYCNNFTLKDCTFVGVNGKSEVATHGSDPSGLILIEGCNMTADYINRGVFIYGKNTVKIKNCVIDALYPFNCDGSNNNVIVEDSELRGWTSYNNDYNGDGTGHSVTFTNCTFKRGVCGYEYAYLRPYTTTIINNCKFSSDFRINPVNHCTLTITNSTWIDGDAVDVTLIDWSEGTSGSPNSPTNTDGTTVSIDGVYVHPQS